jgi:hypothetical protein
MADKINIAELNIDTRNLITETAKIKKELDELVKKQKKLKDSGDTSSATFVKQASEVKQLSSAYNTNVKAITDNTKATTDQTQQTKLLNEVINTEVKSITEARNQNKLLNKLRNDTNATTKEGQAQIKILNERLDKNNKFVKENGDQYLKQKINIGNYEGALQRVSPQLASIVSNLKSMVGGLQAQKVALQASTTTLGGTSKALRVFKLALISTGIGAIVVALGSLIAFFLSTQKGIDAVTKVTRPLQAVFQSFLGVIQELGESLFDAFSNPKEAVLGLWESIKTNIVNRVAGIGGIFKALGKIISSGFTDGYKDLADSTLQVTTGVENLIDKTVDASKKAAAFLAESLKKGAEIDKLTKQIEESENKLIITRAKSLALIKAQELISKDKAKTDKERNDSVKEALRLSNELKNSESSVLDLKIKREVIQQSLNDTDRKDNAVLNKLKADQITLQQSADARRLRFLGVQNQLQNELSSSAIKRLKEELNFFISQQDVKNNSIEDSIELERQISIKKLAILDSELLNKKISETKYNTEVLKIKNSLISSESKLFVDAAKKELSDFNNKNKSKIESEKFLTEEIFKEEKLRLERIAAEQRKFELLKLEKGVSSKNEYDSAINKIDEDNRLSNEALQTERDEAKKEKDIIDLENKMLANQEQFENEFEIKQNQLNLSKQAELESVEKTGADTKLINEKYAKFKEELEAEKRKTKLNSDGKAFGDIAEFIGKESALGKAAALAQAGINIELGITKALASKGFAGIIEGALIAAKGAVSVGKISGAKFEKGGIASIDGNSHAQGGVPIYAGNKYIGEAEGKEGIGILSRPAFSKFMDFNNSFGSGSVGTTFAQQGGVLTPDLSNSSNLSADDVLSLINELPRPVVYIEQIKTAVAETNEIEVMANI